MSTRLKKNDGTFIDADNIIVGPSTTTANAIALFDGTTGKLIKDSVKTISTDGALTTNSDAKVPTEKAVKTYAHAKVTPATHIADPAGGATVDAEARAAIVLILNALEAGSIVAP